MTGNLQSLKYSNECGNKPTLVVLDQLLIPHEKVYVDIPDVQAAWSVIRTMQIRGRFGALCVKSNCEITTCFIFIASIYSNALPEQETYMDAILLYSQLINNLNIVSQKALH